jgi:hypothetical protein
MAITPAAKRTLRDSAQGKPARNPVTIAAVPAGGTGATAGAWSSSANRDAAITSINKVIQLLKDLGYAV